MTTEAVGMGMEGFRTIMDNKLFMVNTACEEKTLT
jgi:hypothetical protein